MQLQDIRENGRGERRSPGREGSPQTLDELASLSYSELLNLYKSRASAPSQMGELDGELRGRALAVRGTRHGPMFRTFSFIERRRRFPWEGKNLSARSATEGNGVNRIKLPGLGRQLLFRFVTRFDASVLDRSACVFIDYDNKDNPWWIRKIRDEVRSVSPGLFLGPVLWRRRSRSATLVAWFALQKGSAEAAKGT